MVGLGRAASGRWRSPAGCGRVMGDHWGGGVRGAWMGFGGGGGEDAWGGGVVTC